MFCFFKLKKVEFLFGSCFVCKLQLCVDTPLLIKSVVTLFLRTYYIVFNVCILLKQN